MTSRCVVRSTVVRGLAAVLVAAAVAPASAAADATLTFDDLAAGTTVGSHYGGQGVTFGPTPPGHGQATRNLPVVTNVGSAAASGSHIGRVDRRCLTTECVGTTEVWWQYSGGPRSRVSVSVGAFGTATVTLRLTAFTSGGTAISSTSTSPSSASVTGGTGFRTRLTVASASTNIVFVRVRSSSIGSFGVDSVTHDTPAPPPPSFTVRPRGVTSLDVVQGASAGIDLVIDRINYTGSIRLTADQATLPGGVTMDALDTTGTSQTVVRVTFRASSTAALRAGTQVRIIATPATSPPSAQSTTVTVDVVALTDSRVTGVEVTQGVQTLRLPWDNTFVATTKTYRGVPLYANGKTVVRVYANNGRNFNPSGLVPGASIRLHGVDAATGATLPLSPLLPDAGPTALRFSPFTVPLSDERAQALRAFTFTLPPHWTGDGVRTTTSQRGFDLRLRAELVLQPSQTLLETNTTNNTMTLDRAAFTPTCCLDVATLRLRHDRFPGDPRPIRTILREALNVLPLEWNVPDYQATYDVTQEIDEPGTDSMGNPIDPRDLIAADMIEFSQRDPKNDIVVGFGVAGLPVCTGGAPFMACDDLEDRPYTSSAHEFFHALGPVIEDATFSNCVDGDISCHASRACDANNSGTAWPPDEIGLLQGIALDRTFAPPFRIMATPPGVPQTVGVSDPRGIYDFMSYCAGDATSWLGPKNWTDVLDRFARNASPPGSASVLSPRRPRAAQAARAPGLVVNAIVTPSGGAAIAAVYPGAGDRGTGSRPSPYVLAVRDRAGALLARAPMRQRAGDRHRGVASLTVTGVAAVPVPRAARVEVLRDGTVLASRNRSTHPPVARFLSPRMGQLVGRSERLTIRWQAADADRDPLRTIVEWSARGGRPGTWRSVSIGPNGGRVALPSEYFGGSDDALLRLRVNDGFNETVVLSPPFRTVHRGPRVRIVDPAPGRLVRRDATLFLRAIAHDERGVQLTGSALRWSDGGKDLGSGEQLALTGLAAGRHRIRVAAVDRRGRTASAAVAVRVRRVVPRFVRLSAPRRISAGTRRVVLRVASSVPGTLTVSERGVRRARVPVGRAQRRVLVPVRRSRGALRLALALRADGLVRRAEVVVAR